MELVEFKIRSRYNSPKGSSEDNNLLSCELPFNDRSNKIDLTHETSKENLSKVYNDNTVDEKTSNNYSDDELIDFNLVSTATNVSNLSSINKNNSNAYDIMTLLMLMKKKQ